MQTLTTLLLFLCALLGTGFSAPYTTRDFFNSGGLEHQGSAKMQQGLDTKSLFLNVFKTIATKILSQIPSEGQLDQQKQFLVDLLASKEGQIQRHRQNNEQQLQQLQQLQAKEQQSFDASGNPSEDTSNQILSAIVNLLGSAPLNM